MRNRVHLLCGAAVGISSLASASIASAASLYDSQGFEAPAYQVGPLVGQPAGAATADKWQNNVSGGVQANIFQYGGSTQQGVVMPVNGAAGDFGYWYPGTYLTTPYTTTGDVNISWTERYASGATGNPFFGITVFNGNDEIAMLGVDATNNNLALADGVNGTYETSTYTAAPDTYFTLQIALHYGTQSFDAYENGTKLTSSPLAFVTPATSFTDADLTGYQVLGSSNFAGTGYYDDYLVTASPVPEPAALTMLSGVALLGVASRRRNHRTLSDTV